MFTIGQRVATESGNLTGTVVGKIGEYVDIQWDDDDDWVDEVHQSLLRPITA